MPDAKRMPIIFLLGPSGSGKTTLGSWLAEDLGMLHLEIDRWPDGDGIDLEGLRSAWDAFLRNGQAVPLAGLIRTRAVGASRQGAVLTFPSLLVLNPAVIRAAEQAGIRSFVLYGTRAQCLTAFLARGRATGRRLNEEQWMKNNSGSYIEYSREEFTSHRLDAFTEGGHRTRADLVEEVEKRLAS